MWKIWIIFSVFKFSFSAPVDSKEDSAAAARGDTAVFRCLLLASHISACDDIKRYSNDLPKRLQKLYDSVKRPFRDLTQDEALLDSNTIEHLPTSLFYLIPRIRLQNMTGHAAANILRRTPDDEALAIKLASLLTSEYDRTTFLESLSNIYEEGTNSVKLSDGVDFELGRALAIWYPIASEWHHERFQSAMEAGSPVLAHLPAHFINRLTPKVAEKFLFHIRNWRPDFSNNTLEWEKHSARIKRIWTYTALQKWDQPMKWFPGVARLAGYLLLGATPDEIPTIVSYIQQPSLFQYLLIMNFPPLQARALYDVVRSSYTDNFELKNVRQILPKLLPRQIQQFDTATIDVTTNLPNYAVASLPTQKQLFESHLAHLVHTKKLPNVSPSSWKNDISLLGRAVHLLPASSLAVLVNETISISSLSHVTSNLLSFRQARYLTNNGQLLNFDHIETIVNAKEYLKALPAHTLRHQHTNIIPEVVRGHLLRHVPAENLALRSAILERIYLDLDDRSVLRALFANSGHNEILSLLNGRDLMSRVANLKKSLSALVSEGDDQLMKIRMLPANIGRMLLTDFRHEIADQEDGWTLDNLIINQSNPLLRPLISNLQCVDIERVNDVDALAVLGYYVRERKALGLNFPKNMQYCCQKALTRYLKLKSTLRHVEDYAGLLNVLELFEVKAVGGYILSSLPLDVIDSALVKHHIIREIGALSLPELLAATSLSNLHVFADSYEPPRAQGILLRDMLELGNLIWYLNLEHVRRLGPSQFKLVLEMMEPGQPRVPCLTTAEREIWREFLIQTVGKPDTWTSGTLALLGDLLFVFDVDDLDLVTATARVEAADVMANSTAFHHLVDWPGKLKPITYYEACVEALPANEKSMYSNSVLTLIRFYLESSEMLLNTVIPADTFLRLNDDLNDIDNDSIAEKSLIKRSTGEEELEDDKKTKKENKKKRRNKKRLLNDPTAISTEDKKKELLANGTRALVVVFETEIDENNTKVLISEKFPRRSMEISCDAIRMLGMPASWILKEDDLDKWTQDQLDDCSEVLGSLNLSTNLRKMIWPKLTKWKESGNLLEVGSIVSVIEEDDLIDLYLNLDSPWALESLATLSQHVTNPDILALIGDRFILHNPNLTSLRYGEAAALGRIVCNAAGTRQQKLLLGHGVFSQVAPILGATIDDTLCIEQMGAIAKIAYGPVNQWSADDVSTLGVIMAGLPKADWSSSSGLKCEAMSGLTPSAASRLPSEVFKVLSEEQLLRLPPLSVAAISPAQTMSLSPAQSEVLERVRRQIPDKNLRASKSSATSIFATSLTSVVAIFAIAIRAVV